MVMRPDATLRRDRNPFADAVLIENLGLERRFNRRTVVRVKGIAPRGNRTQRHIPAFLYGAAGEMVNAARIPPEELNPFAFEQIERLIQLLVVEVIRRDVVTAQDEIFERTSLTAVGHDTCLDVRNADTPSCPFHCQQKRRAVNACRLPVLPDAEGLSCRT